MTTTFITLDVWQPSDIRVKVNQGEVNSRFLQVCVTAQDKLRESLYKIYSCSVAQYENRVK